MAAGPHDHHLARSLLKVMQDPFNGVAGFYKDLIRDKGALGKVAGHSCTKRLDLIPNALKNLIPVASLHFLPTISTMESLHDHQDIGRQIFEHVEDGYFRSIAIRYSDRMPKSEIGVLRVIRGMK